MTRSLFLSAAIVIVGSSSAFADRSENDAAVIAAIESAPGSFTTVEVEPGVEAIATINLSKSGLSLKSKRETDPYDAEFYKRVGQLAHLKELRIANTKPESAWLAPLGQLTQLEKLEFINTGLDDAALSHLAPLKDLNRFAFIGNGITGAPFEFFVGWDQLTSSSFRGSKIDDAGLKWMVERFPNYETLGLAHARFTDAGAVEMKKWSRLTHLEIGSKNATTACLQNLVDLPLEYLQLGDGLDDPAGVAIIRNIPTLRRLTLTKAGATMTVEDLQQVAAMTQLTQLEIGGLPSEIPQPMIDGLVSMTYLKDLRLANYGEPFTEATVAAISAGLPEVEVKFK